MVKLHWLLFVCCIGMCAVIAAAFFIEEHPRVEVVDPETGSITLTPQGHGMTHPEFKTMKIGGDGKERHGHILWLGWIFGLLICTFFVSCLAFGTRSNDEVGPYAKPITIGCVLFLIVFSMMMWTYRAYMNGDTDGRILSVPSTTAWMLYGIWFFPIYFLITFYMMFDKHYWNEEKAAKFRDILRSRSSTDEGGDS